MVVETPIIKVLIGSQAHGLANEGSDYDYRGVFALPTSQILSLGGSKTNTHWLEGNVDDTSWEIGHFMHLATKCNPTIMEVFLAPVVEETEWSKRLQELFPEIWNSLDVYNAFRGYGVNQRKKFLEDKDLRPYKFATAYARVLYNAYELLTTGTFTIKIIDTDVGDTVRDIKDGRLSHGEIIDFCRKLEEKVEKAYQANPDKKTNMDAANEFLLDIRKTLW